jgi:hypothetical protein
MSLPIISADQASWTQRFADHLHSLRDNRGMSCSEVADSQFGPWGHLDPIDAAILYAQCETSTPSSAQLG